MLKRFFAVILSVLLLISFCGCFLLSDREANQTAAPTPESETPVPTPTETPVPTEAPTPEPTKTPADLWKEIDAQYPALRGAISKLSLSRQIYDPSAFGIDVDALLPIQSGTKEELEQCYADLRTLLNHVCEVDRFALDDTDLFAFNTVTESLKSMLNRKDFLLYDDPFTPHYGWHMLLLSVFVSYRIASVDDIESYLEMLSYIPEYLDKLLTREQARFDENGWFMTEYALDSVLEEISYVRDAGKSFHGYSYLGECMDALGMSAEEQAPYLARNEAAVDAVIAAYDNLYSALDGMREHCSNPDTPYEGVPSVENNAWRRSYDHFLSETVGYNNSADAYSISSLYEYVLISLSHELYEIVASSPDFYNKTATYQPKTPITHYTKTMKLLEEKFGPLSGSINTKYLPKLRVPYYGNFEWIYYYDNPEASIQYISPDVSNSSVLLRSNACFTYFFRYFLQQPDLSRAQIYAAPTTYYSGLASYTALMLTKEEAERTGDYTEWYTLSMNMYYSLLTGYTADLIAMGYGHDLVIKYLTEYFQLPEDYAEQIFNEARANPVYMIDGTYGYVKMYILRDGCKNRLEKRFDEHQFIMQYLSYGPSYPYLIGEKMQDWCDGMLNSDDV